MFAGACSGTDQVGVDATAKDSSSGPDVLLLPDTGTPGDTGTSSDAGSDAAPNPDLGCATSDAGCIVCCFDNHPDGSANYFDTLTTCACSTGATCHSVSNCYNNFCKGNVPSQNCDNCLSNPDAGDCYNKADQACANDPDCVAFFECVDVVCAPPSTDAAAD